MQNRICIRNVVKGIDHADLLLARAPKPLLLVTTSRDFFSIQGVLETEYEVSRFYKAFGKEENFARSEDDTVHASTLKNREAMYAFFQKHLNNPGNIADEEIQKLTVEEMKVTETGQVLTSLKSETVFSLNSKEAEKLFGRLQSSRKDQNSHLKKVLDSAKKLSGYIEPENVESPVFTGRFAREGYAVEKYFVRGEGRYVLPYLLFVPEKSNGKALIYLHPAGKAAEAGPDEEMEWFAKNGITVLAPDLAGIGETGTGSYNGNVYTENPSYSVWFASMLTGRSITGIRAGDVTRLTMILNQREGINGIYGLARKEMAPVLLHAAAFNGDINRIALIEPYVSFQSVVMNRFYKLSFMHSSVPGAIGAYDLPDLAATLAPGKLLITDITDGSGAPSVNENVMRELEVIRSTYKAVNAENKLNIIVKSSGKPYDLYTEWIK